MIATNFDTLTGQAVILRRMRREDADLIVKWRNEPEVAEQMFSEPPTLEQHLRWFEGLAGSSARKEFVIETAPDGVPVGTIGLSAIDHRHRRAEYGILIGERSASDRGYATDASRVILDFAFRTLALDRVFLQLFRDNVRASRLYGRLGFIEEGILRSHAVRGGVARDVMVMGLLRAEWERSQ